MKVAVVFGTRPEAIASAVKRFYEGLMEEEFIANVKIEKKKYSWNNFVDAIEGFFK